MTPEERAETVRAEWWGVGRELHTIREADGGCYRDSQDVFRDIVARAIREAQLDSDPYRALCLALAVYCDVKGAANMTDADWSVLGFDPGEMAGKPTAWRLLKIRANILIDQAVDEGRKTV